MNIDSFGVSIAGRRGNNEDNFTIGRDVFVVADGLGGYEGGEVASRITVEAVRDLFERQARDEDATWPFAYDRKLSLGENLVATAVRRANAEIVAKRAGKLRSMGSTIVVLHARGSQLVLGHAGDSRIYRLRDGVLEQRTVDHSYYEQLKATTREPMPPLEKFPFSNIIVRALGLDQDVRADLSLDEARAGDVFLLCSDGLTLKPHEITEELAEGTAERAAKALVDKAFAAGSHDNITALVVRFT